MIEKLKALSDCLRRAGCGVPAEKINQARLCLPEVEQFVNEAFPDWSAEQKEQRIFDMLVALVR